MSAEVFKDMIAEQLEFPLEDLLSAEEKMVFIEKRIQDVEMRQGKIQRRIFAENSQRKAENKQITTLLESLISLLKKSQFEV